jgi:hypothetical protein
MQPTYLPWLGYLDLIDASDAFIFLDDVQFQRKSWHHRNYIKGPNGPIRLTIPVLQKGKRFQKIDQVVINNQEDWARSHLRSLEIAYSKSRYFQEYFQFYKNLYEKKWEWLVDLNIAFILLLMKLLSIKTPTLRASSMEIDLKGNLKVIELCKKMGADKLYDAAGAVDFIDNEKFQAENIEVEFQNYEHPTYSQLYGEFISHMSVVDLLFNEGPKSLEIIRSGSSRFYQGGE